MDRRRLAQRRLLGGAAVVLCLVLACDSPFEPQGDGERIPIGLVIEQDVTSDTARFYSFATNPNAAYAVYLQSLEGDVWLRIVDSVSGSTVANLNAAPDPSSPRLEDNAVASFGSPQARRVCKITVQTFGSGTTARFRFKIYQIETDPEHRALFPVGIGDTVNGETIDPNVDIDRFVVMGSVGQEVVFVGETPAPVGSGSVSFALVDTVGQQFLGYVLADAGPPTLATGRMRLPATRGYSLSVGSVISNVYPRYSGPYRFWSYAINRAPEHRTAAIPFNTEITSEAIERAGDVDEFAFQANPSTAFMAFLQSTRPLQAEMALPDGPPLAIAACQGSDTSLFGRVTNRLEPTQVGNYLLRVAGASPSQIADTGRYRVFLYAIDRRPEHVAAAIPAGAAVLGEDIGLPGDVDEFTFTGVAGELVDAFFQAQNGSPDDRLQLQVIDPAGSVMRSIQSTGTDTSLFRQVTGRFALPSPGTYRLRVTGYDGYCARGYRGAYQVFLHRVNGRPETVPDTLAFGDSLSGESIDLPGDFDEFRVTVPDSSGANLAFELQAPSPPYPGLIVTLIDASTGRVVATASGSQNGSPAATGRLSLAPGRYVVRVDASVEYDFSVVRGPYRLWFYRFGFGPEIAVDTFAIGDTVSGESLEPWGDQDRFLFYGLRDQHVNVMVQGLAPPSGGNDGFQFLVIPPPGVPGYGAFINSPPAAGALEDHQTTRLDLLGTGWYTFQVQGYNGGLAERGPYRFTVLPIDPVPEHVSATVIAGSSVTSEPIDEPGDWDEFTITGAPGETMSVLFDSDVFTGLYLTVFDPATADTLASQPNQFRRIAGPFQIPATGQVRISVAQPMAFFRLCYSSTCSSPPLFSAVGPYGFHVIAVNREPESAAAAFAVGDTVRGESIATVGDIDEFTSTGTPGEQLTLVDRLTTMSNLDSALVLEIIDPTTGASLGGGGTARFGDTFYPVSTFTVPASGTFIVRARVYGEWGYGVGLTSAYEFFVRRGS